MCLQHWLPPQPERREHPKSLWLALRGQVWDWYVLHGTPRHAGGDRGMAPARGRPKLVKEGPVRSVP